MRKCENCFIDVYDRGRKIDTVPLHKQQLYAALQIERNAEDEEPVFSKWNGLTAEQFKNCLHKDEISIHTYHKTKLSQRNVDVSYQLSLW